MADHELKLELRSRSVIIGSDLVADLQVINRGAAAITVPNPGDASSPQPVYTLRLPDGSARQFAGRTANSPDQQPTLVEIPARSLWKGDLTVNRLTSLDMPGRYALAASLDWDGLRLRSEPVAFTVSAAQFEALAVSVARADDGSGGQAVELLRATESSRELWSAPLREEDPTLGEMHRPKPDPVIGTALPDGIATPLGLRHNADPLTAADSWSAVTGRGGLWWTAKPDAPLKHVAFGADFIGAPVALVSRGKVMTICAALATAPAATLSVARIAVDALQPVQPERIHAFTRPPQAIAATIGSVAAGSPIIVAALTALPGKTLLTVLRIDGSGNGRLRVERSNAFTLPGVQPVGGVSVIVAPDGRIEAVALLEEEHDAAHDDDHGPPRYSRVVWTIRPDLELQSAQLSSSFRLPALKGGNALIDVQHGQRLQRDGSVATIMVLRHRGKETPLVMRDEDGGPRNALIQLPARVPYVLARGRHVWYAVRIVDGVVEADQL